MPAISAAIICLAGVMLMFASVAASPLTNDSRARLAGWGWVFVSLGFVAWIISFLVEFTRMMTTVPS